MVDRKGSVPLAEVWSDSKELRSRQRRFSSGPIREPSHKKGHKKAHKKAEQETVHDEDEETVQDEEEEPVVGKYDHLPKHLKQRHLFYHPKVRTVSGKEPNTKTLTVHTILRRRISLSDKFAKDWDHLTPTEGRKVPTFAEKAWYLFHPYEFEIAKEDEKLREEQRILLSCFDRRTEALVHARTRHMYAPRVPCTPFKVLFCRWWRPFWRSFRIFETGRKRGPAGARIDEWNRQHPNSWEDGEYWDELEHNFDWYF